jgi:quercetin dioxygenase-like cupin family protein
MRTSLCLLWLAIGALPLAAQPDRRMLPPRNFPPDLVPQNVINSDILRLGSSHVSVDFENDRARVLRLTLAAGESIPIHDDRAGVLVCIAGCRIRFTRPDGQSQDLELKAGETRWMPDARHATLNIAGAPVELLYIETKRPQP